MNFGATIAKLRANAGLSQQDVADKLDMARATYASLESGRRQPDLPSILNIAEFYQISPSDLISGTVTPAQAIVPHDFTNQDEIEPREISPKISPEKLREVLAYVLDKIGAKPNVGETVLYKLLYFIDFDYYEKHGKSITGLTYIHNHFGPSPVADFKSVVEGMKEKGELEVIETKYFKNTQKKYLPTKQVLFDELSARELEHINETLARLGDKTARELTELSHYDTPWVVARQGKPLDYRDTFYRTKLTAVTEPEDEL